MGSKVITILFVSLLLGMLIPAVLPDSEIVRDSSFFISLDRIAAQGPAEIKLTASDPLAGAQFGHTVALDGDTAVIGAPGDNGFTGAVYIFSFNGANWSQAAKLTASDGQAGDVFGRSVALDGDTLVVGANGDDEAGTNAGAAYVFRFNGTTWTETAKLTPSVAGAVFFGWSVALDGQTIAVGAPHRVDQGQVINTGAVYIYQADNNNWVEAARLSTSSSGGPVLSDLFGWAVTLDGATLVVGSYLSDQAHVFTSGGAGWTKTATLSGSDTVANDRFGWAVAIEGSTIVVGAVQEDTAGVIAGAAYLFQANGNDWRQTAKLTPTGMSRGSRFGWSVDIAGETVVVGARESPTPLDHTEAGSVYVFEFDGSGWGQGVELYASDAAEQDHLGNSVSLSGEFILAGAPGRDGAGTDVGVAYLFVGDGGSLPPPPNQPPLANFSYQGLGHLHHAIRESKAYGVSADGSVVVGYSSSGQGAFEAFRWTETGGMAGLGGSRSQAHDISAGGSVVVGYGGSDSDPQAFRWTEAGGMVNLDSSKSRAYGVSADGLVVVGERAAASDYEAFRWTQAGGMVNLGFLPGNPPELSPFSYAWDASADGSVVVGGSSAGLNRIEAFRWTQAGGMVGLGDLAGGIFNSGARAVSTDGAVVVGYGRSDSGPEAFRWTQAGGMVGLGDLPGGSFESYAWGVSADGAVVVGWGTTDIGSEAFIWDAEHGMRNLKSVLTAGGLDLTGWTLSQAWDISADGLTIVGFGINPAGQIEAWRVTLSGDPGGEDELTQFCVAAEQSVEEVLPGVVLTWGSSFHCANAPDKGSYEFTVTSSRTGENDVAIVIEALELTHTTPRPLGQPPTATFDVEGLPTTINPDGSQSFTVSGDYELVATEEGKKANLHFCASGQDQNVPFYLGLNAHFRGPGASEDEESDPPLITNIQIVPRSNGATITWNTNEPATSQVLYGPDLTTASIASSGCATTESHRVDLVDLLPETTYVFQVYSKDGLGNLAISDELSFTTTAGTAIYLPLIFNF